MLIVGHHKGGGGDTKQKIFRNFGYAQPEGYRKALRAMKLAEKFSRPVIAFIDTPAAYPGVESEERGHLRGDRLQPARDGGARRADRRRRPRRRRQRRRARHRDRRPDPDARVRDLQRDPAGRVRGDPVARLEPQGRGGRSAEADRAGPAAASAIIDEIVPEPIGGAHTNHELAAALLDAALERALADGRRRWIRPRGSTRGTRSSARWATSASVKPE